MMPHHQTIIFKYCDYFQKEPHNDRPPPPNKNPKTLSVRIIERTRHKMNKHYRRSRDKIDNKMAAI